MVSLTIIALSAVIASASLGLLPNGKVRTIAIAILWLVPLWIILWLTINHYDAVAFEFGSGWAYLGFTPLFLAEWSPVTVFPFMLSKRLLQIQRGL